MTALLQTLGQDASLRSAAAGALALAFGGAPLGVLLVAPAHEPGGGRPCPTACCPARRSPISSPDPTTPGP